MTILTDSNGKVIKEQDVVKDVETGEMGIIVYGVNHKLGIRDLAVVNEDTGLHDWLDIFPDGVWEVVGNWQTSVEN